MSVSDVVMIEQQDGTSTAYFCDSIGFKEIEFMPAEETVLKKNTITVVMVEPGERARIAEIGTSLSQMQQAVGGLIEAYYPFEEEVCIVCNDEGKYNGMNPNRAIYCEPEQQDTRQIIDIIYGPFFICDCSGENFGSLNEEQLNRFLHQYELPERFYIGVDGIRAIPYTPTREQKTER